jgi:hypothetical protein
VGNHAEVPCNNNLINQAERVRDGDPSLGGRQGPHFCCQHAAGNIEMRMMVTPPPPQDIEGTDQVGVPVHLGWVWVPLILKYTVLKIKLTYIWSSTGVLGRVIGNLII